MLFTALFWLAAADDPVASDDMLPAEVFARVRVVCRVRAVVEESGKVAVVGPGGVPWVVDVWGARVCRPEGESGMGRAAALGRLHVLSLRAAAAEVGFTYSWPPLRRRYYEAVSAVEVEVP